MSSDSPKTMAQRFFGFCALVLGGIFALWIALEVLSHIWGWLVLAALLFVLDYVGWHLHRRWKDRW